MPDTVIVAIITGGLSLLGVVISNLTSQKATEKLLDYKVNEIKADVATLSNRVDKHNSLVERMAIVEQSVKSAHHRLDGMKGEH